MRQTPCKFQRKNNCGAWIQLVKLVKEVEENPTIPCSTSLCAEHPHLLSYIKQIQYQWSSSEAFSRCSGVECLSHLPIHLFPQHRVNQCTHPPRPLTTSTTTTTLSLAIITWLPPFQPIKHMGPKISTKKRASSLNHCSLKRNY